MAIRAYFVWPTSRFAAELNWHALRFSPWAGGTLLVLGREQRVLLAETVRDIANIAAGAMVFGQFLAIETFSLWIAVGGMAVWVALVGWAIGLTREPKP